MPRPLRIGVQLPEVERDVRWPEYAAMAARGRGGRLRLDLGRRPPALPRATSRPERGPWDAWALLAALAASTSRVHLGPLVACTGFHPPGLIARMAAAIDEISGGRFVLGLGCGWNEAEFAAFGIPYDHRVARFEEAFAIIRGLLAGERVTLDGRYWQADDAVLLPPPARRTPLVIGSNGPRMLGIALPHVDAWNTWWDGYGNTVAGFAELNAEIDAAARQGGPARGRDRAQRVRARRAWTSRAGERAPLPGLAPVAGDPRRSPGTCTAWPRPAPTRRSSCSTRSPSARCGRSGPTLRCSTAPTARVAELTH